MKIIKLLSTLSLVAGIGFTTVSCLDNDVNEDLTSYGYLPATKLEINHDSIQPVGKPTNLKITYSLTGNCQKFLEFQKLNSSTLTTIDIGAYGSQDNSAGCTNDIRYETKNVKYTAVNSGENIIRVWAGVASNGENIFKTDTIIVPEN